MAPEALATIREGCDTTIRNMLQHDPERRGNRDSHRYSFASAPQKFGCAQNWCVQQPSSTHSLLSCRGAHVVVVNGLWCICGHCIHYFVVVCDSRSVLIDNAPVLKCLTEIWGSDKFTCSGYGGDFVLPVRCSQAFELCKLACGTAFVLLHCVLARATSLQRVLLSIKVCTKTEVLKLKLLTVRCPAVGLCFLSVFSPVCFLLIRGQHRHS